ncbi:CoA pyrophosphatase [Psychrosphaera aestuarii]|uniref:CoA pyrophosphatase n=1 Tax=Psychrosphaera aestuarii TaxID=1266052 RepID=UPI001B32E272|nr:CoA pyrophosphatase [Psychrosphaera aestuarii]
MSPEEFASRLCLRPFEQKYEADYGRFGPAEPLKRAAVLIPVIERAQGLHILLTQRANHLRNHPGQISFPGGKHDETDDTLKDTAIRESEEEIGLDTRKIQPLGWLPELHTVSHFTMSPLVALVDGAQEFVANEGEVSDIFEIPLSYLLQRKHQFYLTPNWQGKPHKIHFIRYENKLIWGATAAILQKLIRHIE